MFLNFFCGLTIIHLVVKVHLLDFVKAPSVSATYRVTSAKTINRLLSTLSSFV